MAKENVMRQEPYEGPDGKLLMGQYQNVCPVEAVPPGSQRAVEAYGMELLVWRPEDGQPDLAVTGSLCPHEEVPLIQGLPHGGILRCFEHGYGFDLKTGACDFDPDLRLPVFPSRIAEGWVQAILL